MTPHDALPSALVAPSRQPAAEQEVEAVAAMLRLASGMLASSRRLDLAGMDQMVGRLCARCLDLPPEEGRAMRPHLAGLLAEIDALNATIPVPPGTPQAGAP